MSRKPVRLIFGILCAAGAIAATAVRAEEDFRFEEVEAQVLKSGYSNGFIDSLKNVKVVVQSKALRCDSSSAPLYRERLVYRVGWGFLFAGNAVISTAPDRERPHLMHVHVTALSNDAISKIFKVRDYLHSVFDIRGMYPLFYEEHIREGKYKANRWTLYDHAYGKAHTHSSKFPSVLIPPFAQNVVSVLYYLRTRAFGPGETVTIEMLVDEKTHKVAFVCTGRDTVEIRNSTYKCLVVEPVLVGKGRVFSEKDKVRIYLSDDQFRIPVMFKVKVFFGHLNGELIQCDIDKERPIAIGAQ
jgi:hypothetical protein